MTDICNAQLCNKPLGVVLNKIVYSLFCHNHLRNVWVKNVLSSLNEFMHAHLYDSLDKIADEL